MSDLNLIIARQLLTQARLAVELKAERERPELRKAVAREIYIKQFEETEDEVGTALEPIFIDQIQSISERLVKLDIPAEKSLAPVSDQAQSLIAQSFDPAEWQDDLVGRMLPVLAKKMLEAAQAQLRVMGFDRKAIRAWRDKATRVSSRGSASGATTATEWLNDHPGDAEELGKLLAATGTDVALLTEMPHYMQKAIAKQLADTFKQLLGRHP